MESEQTLSLSLECICKSSVNFACKELCPSLEAHDALMMISFGLEDILCSASLDAVEFGRGQTDALPLSSQEAWSSLFYKLA